MSSEWTNPKVEGRKKAETRRSKPESPSASCFGLRISALGIRSSDFKTQPAPLKRGVNERFAKPGVYTGVIQSRQRRRAPPTLSIILHRMISRPSASGEYLRSTSVVPPSYIRSTSVCQTEVLRTYYGGTTDVPRRYHITWLLILAAEVGPEGRFLMVSLKSVTIPRRRNPAKGGMEAQSGA